MKECSQLELAFYMAISMGKHAEHGGCSQDALDVYEVSSRYLEET